MQAENVSLFYKEGSSDKIYNASLIPTGGGWVVKYEYGRRGSALSAGTKTEKPVDFDTAKKIYTKLVANKTGKGYTPVAGASVFSGSVNETRDTGHRPQLLNEIEESEVEKHISNDEYCAQEKHDGRRRLLIKDSKDLIGANRKGLSVALPDTIMRDAGKSVYAFTLDGEAIADYIMAFDLLEYKGEDIRDLSYIERYKKLCLLIVSLGGQDNVRQVKTAFTKEEKSALYKELVSRGAEGIVFKKKKAKYTPGRPNSGGDQLKYKFYATASAIVGKVNTGKRSVELYMLTDDGKQTGIGNATVYPNQDIPEKGTIAEVKYLYAFKNGVGGTLYQPVLLGLRDDLSLSDCNVKQLKFKSQEDDATDEA